MLDLRSLNPAQAMAASIFFKKKRLLLALPRQFGGKTELGVRLLYDLTSRPFTTSSLFLAKDYNSGKRATSEKFKRIFDAKHFVVNTELIYLKKHPTSVIHMASVDRDPDRLRGGTHSLIHWSEVAFSKIEHGETIISVFDKVVQPTTFMTDGYAYLETTMNGANGFKDLWDCYKDYGFARLKLGLDDFVYMGIISQEDYERVQNSMHPDIFRQEMCCEFISFLGRAYPEFKPEIHVKKLDAPQPWQMVVISLDWGWSPSATCVLFGYVKEGVLHVFDEHYKKEELAEHTAEHIKAKLEAWHITKFQCVADHDPARIEELNRRGIPCGQAHKVNVLGARVEIKEKLYFNKMLIDPRCTFTIRDLSTAIWHPKKEGELDDGMCTYGHWDAESALRYMVREFGQSELAEPQQNPHIMDTSSIEWEIINAKTRAD